MVLFSILLQRWRFDILWSSKWQPSIKWAPCVNFRFNNLKIPSATIFFEKIMTNNRKTPFHFFCSFSDNLLQKYLENDTFCQIFKCSPPSPRKQCWKHFFWLGSWAWTFYQQNQTTLNRWGEGRGHFSSSNCVRVLTYTKYWAEAVKQF